MSWYIGEDGEQIWIKRDSAVFTVVVSDKPLPTEQLSYLAVSSKKAVYQEAICDDDLSAGGRSKRKEKQTGKQRGFIIRAVEESPLARVIDWFKDPAKQLMNCAVVSRVDADEAANVKKAKKKEKDLAVPNLGANECRIETTSRIHHFAHGPGFRVEVSEGTSAQRLNMFTSRREIPLKDWLAFLLKALESRTGRHVMILKRSGKEVLGGAVGEKQAEEAKVQLRRDKAQQAENEWLQSLLSGQAEEAEPEPEVPAESPEAPAPPAALPEMEERPAPASGKAKPRRERNKEWQAAPEPGPGAWTEWEQSWQGNTWDEWPSQAQAPVRRWVNKVLCHECGRGQPLKLFWDQDASYCRMCWFKWYGEDPPKSAAVR
ncbi:unnamed protein product [Effrenium voratum]|nr:unnamed protein product [Effrenium voratum]